MGPTFKVVMFSTMNIHAYSSLSAEINRRYCEHHGYGFVHEEYDQLALAPQFEKIKVLRRHHGSADYLFWLDSDACVINVSQRLEDFCQTGKDFITSGYKLGFDAEGGRVRYTLDDIPCGLNSGVMLIRSSDWSRQFLDAWWSQSEIDVLRGVAYWDQGTLQQMLVENTLDFRSHLQLVTPSSRLNRCNEDNLDVCDFILHLWGIGANHRERIFSEIHAGKRPDISVSMPYFQILAK